MTTVNIAPITADIAINESLFFSLIIDNIASAATMIAIIG